MAIISSRDTRAARLFHVASQSELRWAINGGSLGGRMSTLRFSYALGLMLTCTAASAAAQGYAQQGYDPQQQQQYPQQQYQQPQQQYQQYPAQQQYEQQQPPPGYFPTPDAQGALNYTAPNAPYPDAQQAQNAAASDAQGASPVAGAFQVSGGISLIQVNSLSMKQDMTAASVPAVTTPPAMTAAAAPVDPVVPTCCIVKRPLYLELGYGVSNNIVIGAMVQFASASETVNNGAIPAKDLMLSFAPKFDYQFSPASRLNPFLGGALNITHENKTYYGYKDSRMAFGLALRGGVRYFVLDGLSFDPMLSLGYAVGSGTQTNLTKQPNSNSDYSLSNLQFAVSLGLSVWLK